jgi:glyoxylase-like metal-dependent hydrolase (beta-lactamase superfamily II)
VELREITRDVYACLQQDRGLGYSNSGLVNRGGGLVIDTFWDLPHTRQMIDLYGRVWKQPAGRVVNTHHNGDHCWGNQLFRSAEIIGHRLCAKAMLEENPSGLQALKGAASSDDPAVAALAAKLSDWDFAGVELTPPTTLIEDRLTLDQGGIPTELVYLGPAHTCGDVIVHLPEQRLVFAGDILFRLCTPIGWEGTFARWIEALEYIERLEPEIVPRRGSISAPTRTGPSRSGWSSTSSAPTASSAASLSTRRSTRPRPSAGCTSSRGFTARGGALHERLGLA